MQGARRTLGVSPGIGLLQLGTGANVGFPGAAGNILPKRNRLCSSLCVHFGLVVCATNRGVEVRAGQAPPARVEDRVLTGAELELLRRVFPVHQSAWSQHGGYDHRQGAESGWLGAFGGRL